MRKKKIQQIIIGLIILFGAILSDYLDRKEEERAEMEKYFPPRQEKIMSQYDFYNN